jgi:hypothetical protein
VTHATRILATLTVATALAACSRPSGDQPRPVYDPGTGRLAQLAYDANKNGKNDAVAYMDGTRLLHIDLDLDENGKVERWDFYGPNQALEKVGLSRLNDGVMDAEAFYDPPGTLRRMLISTARDGRFDRVEFYDHGVLARAEEDGNHDGRPDKWETYRSQAIAGANEPAYAITSSAFDDTGSGRPERRFIYGPRGTIARVEIDPDGDGVFAPARASSTNR